jgi:hypothetical protein
MDYFCFSDIHGHGELFDKILDWLNGRSEPWKCIFLGDACDRCIDGYRIIETLLNDDRFIYLKGNHEDLFIRAARALRRRWKEEGIHYNKVAANPYKFITDYMWDWDISCYIQNGGLSTLMGWIIKGKTGLKIINQLDALSEHMELPHEIWGKLDLSHAGHLMDNSDGFIWSREHFQEEFTGGRMIHGHTPVRYLMKHVLLDSSHTARPAFYANGTKVDIDTACFSSNTITLLNLNTFEQHRFTTLI